MVISLVISASLQEYKGANRKPHRHRLSPISKPQLKRCAAQVARRSWDSTATLARENAMAVQRKDMPYAIQRGARGA